MGWIAAGYLLLLALAEYLVTLPKPHGGVVLHAVILTALLVQSALVSSPQQRTFWLTLALVPLIRLVSTLTPLQLFPLPYAYLVVSIPLFTACYLEVRLAGLSRRSISLVKGHLPQQLLIGLSGIVLGLLEYAILRPAPLISALRPELVWLPALILLVSTGFLEELIFRGILQSAAESVLGRYAIGYVSLAFTVMHIGYYSLLDLAFVLGVALLFSYFVKRTGSLLGVTLAHGLINILLYLIVPFLQIPFL